MSSKHHQQQQSPPPERPRSPEPNLPPHLFPSEVDQSSEDGRGVHPQHRVQSQGLDILADPAADPDDLAQLSPGELLKLLLGYDPEEEAEKTGAGGKKMSLLNSERTLAEFFGLNLGGSDGNKLSEEEKEKYEREMEELGKKMEEKEKIEAFFGVNNNLNDREDSSSTIASDYYSKHRSVSGNKSSLFMKMKSLGISVSNADDGDDDGLAKLNIKELLTKIPSATEFIKRSQQFHSPLLEYHGHLIKRAIDDAVIAKRAMKLKLKVCDVVKKEQRAMVDGEVDEQVSLSKFLSQEDFIEYIRDSVRSAPMTGLSQLWIDKMLQTAGTKFQQRFPKQSAAIVKEISELYVASLHDFLLQYVIKSTAKPYVNPWEIIPKWPQ